MDELELPPYTDRLGRWCEYLRQIEALKKPYYPYARRWRTENPHELAMP